MSSSPSLDKDIHELNALPQKNINDFLYEERRWFNVPHFRSLAWNVFIITLVSTNSGFDVSLLNGLQSLGHWADYMGNPTGHVLGALSAGTIFGNLIVFFIGPWMSDRWGRILVIMVGQTFAVIGAILQGLSTNYAFFLISRVVIGAGTGIATVGAPTLISEIFYPKHREVCTFSFNICWYLGATIASAVTYGTRNIDNDWYRRIPSYLQGFFPIIQIASLFWTPESPRFLVANGKHEKARAILSKLHTGNSTDPRAVALVALVDFEMNEIEAALEMERLAGESSNYSDFYK